MDYRDILRSELRRSGDEEDVYRFEPTRSEKIDDINYLTNHVPSPCDIVGALNELIIDDSDNSVRLVPVRPYLQTRLKITGPRLDEMIANNRWMENWLEHIRALQEVKIAEMFSCGNMEDSKLKWMMWLILGESVDLSTARASASSDANSVILCYGNDD